MGERTHGKVESQAKIIQAKHEEEQQAGKKPSEALSRMSANVARPADVQALQQSVGNHTVQRLVQMSGALIQRSFRDDPDYRTWRARMIGVLGPMSQSLGDTQSHHADERTSLNNTITQRNSAVTIWNDASVTGGGGAGPTSESSAGEEGETAATEGG